MVPGETHGAWRVWPGVGCHVSCGWCGADGGFLEGELRTLLQVGVLESTARARAQGMMADCLGNCGRAAGLGAEGEGWGLKAEGDSCT